MKLVLIRHGPTAWNSEKRIQGRTDHPLSAEGIRQVRNRSIPESIRRYQWFSSPLQRARQTAELMGVTSPVVEHALTEMHWGDWEGLVLKPLRKKLGDSMRNNEARGLDFRPPDGESPREVQSRLQRWLTTIAPNGEDCAAVVHKGIIRCTYALAFDWDMRGESPIKFNWEAGHEFLLNESGHLQSHYREVELLTN